MDDKKEAFGTCDSCECDIAQVNDAYCNEYRSGKYCLTCNDGIIEGNKPYAHCVNCDEALQTEREVYGNDFESGYYCQSCNDDIISERENDSDSGSLPEREYTDKNLPEFQSNKAGNIITSKRLFSAEIECYYPDMRTLHNVADELPDGVGISEDGSLGSRGVEFQTPKLKGAQGEKVMRDIGNLLTRRGFTVDGQAGLHIHLDGKGLFPKTKMGDTAASLMQLWAFYLVYEDVLLSFLPASRRNNRYCENMRHKLSLSQIENAATLRDIERLYYKTRNLSRIVEVKKNKWYEGRYMGINMHSLLAFKHIEVRYHSGTVNADKILHWVALHQKILDLAASKELSVDTKVMTLEEKTQSFFSRLNLPDVTKAYLLERQAKFANASNKEADVLAQPVTPICAA